MILGNSQSQVELKCMILKQLLQYVDVNLKMYTTKTVIIYAAINDVLNDKSQSNKENLFWIILNIWCVSIANLMLKYINIWFGLYHKSIVRSVRKNPWKTKYFAF